MTDAATRVSLFDVAEELYGLPLRDFVRVRTVRSREARRDGDAQAADSISAMPKPDEAAWMANQLVRQCRDEVEAFLVLARSLRIAPETMDVAGMKSLTFDFQWAAIHLATMAHDLASSAGVLPSRRCELGLRDTLHAAACTEEMTQLFLLARLSRALPRIGWPGLRPPNLAEIAAANSGGCAPGPPAGRPAAPKAKPVDELARYRERRARSDQPVLAHRHPASVSYLFAADRPRRRVGSSRLTRLEHLVKR